MFIPFIEGVFCKLVQHTRLIAINFIFKYSIERYHFFLHY